MSGSDSTTDFGEHAARMELARCLDVCLDCRRCVDLCEVFPETIELVGTRPSADTGLLTPLEQDRIISLCSHCDLCRDGCPHRPGVGAEAVDLPSTIEAVSAALHRSGRLGWRAGFAGRAVSSDRTLRWSHRLRRLVNPLLGARSGSAARRALSLIFGVTASRPLPVLTEQSFSQWFTRRERPVGGSERSIAILPTCLVDQFGPEFGRDAASAIEASGTTCDLVGVTCCGGGLLESGQVDRFLEVAERNLRVLADVDGGIVVLQSGCLDVLRSDYPRLLGPRAANIVSRARGLVEQLGVVSPEAGTRGAPSLPAAVGLVGSPRGHATGEDERLAALLERNGIRVERIESGSIGEGPGALAEARDAAESTSPDDPAHDLPHDLPLFGLSVVVNRVVEQRLGRPVEPAQRLLAALAHAESSG